MEPKQEFRLLTAIFAAGILASYERGRDGGPKLDIDHTDVLTHAASMTTMLQMLSEFSGKVLAHAQERAQQRESGEAHASV